MTADQLRPTLQYELALYEGGFTIVAGIDEAGRGALAGPVVSAAVVLPLAFGDLTQALQDVRDSKLMTPEARQQALEKIARIALAYAVGTASNQEVDSIGLIPATRLSMNRALAKLSTEPHHLLLDYMLLPEDERPQTSLVKADMQCLSVAAASVVAKVTRDQQMIRMDQDFPGYGFGRHKGYATHEHRRALEELGPSPIHRQTYAPVAAVIR